MQRPPERQSPGAAGLSPFHRAFDRLYPLIRFTYERLLGLEWYSEITPGFWVGGAPDHARDYELIVRSGISAVVDIRAERADDTSYYHANGIEYVRYAVPDMGVPDEATISDAVEWMRRRRSEGRSILVHCAKGRGRSATLAAAYLMCENAMDYDEARELLLSRRRLTKLEDRHRARLEDWWRRGGCLGGASSNDSQEGHVAAEPTSDLSSMPDSYWRKRLAPEQYLILRRAHTERPFTGSLLDEKSPGTYKCAGCGRALFSSDRKFDSGSGWPSFSDVVDRDGVVLHTDRAHGMVRTEVLCADCRGHLGHVFEDGPEPTGLRYCINSGALEFEPREAQP